MYEVGSQLLATMASIPDLSHDVVKDVLPTAEEAGFKLTINLGQVLQIFGFGIFAFKYYTAVVVKHAIQSKDIENLKINVDTLKDDVKEIRSDMKQLPAILQGVHRNSVGNAAILGKVERVPTAEDQLNSDEFMTKLAEKLIELGRK